MLAESENRLAARSGARVVKRLAETVAIAHAPLQVEIDRLEL